MFSLLFFFLSFFFFFFFLLFFVFLTCTCRYSLFFSFFFKQKKHAEITLFEFSYLFFYFSRDVITLQLTLLHKQKAAENFRAAMGYLQRRLTQVRAQQTQAQPQLSHGGMGREGVEPTPAAKVCVCALFFFRCMRVCICKHSCNCHVEA